MTFSRRTLIQCLGMGAAAAAGVPNVAAASLRRSLQNNGPTDLAESASGPIRFDATDSVYGPPPAAIAAMRDALSVASDDIDVSSQELRQKIAKLHGVKPEQVVLGCGSRDILRMAASAFTGPQATLVTAFPTFELIGRYATRAGATVAAVRVRTDFSHDLESMLREAHAQAGLVYICNPNNPTGSLTCRDDLEVFLRDLPPSVHVVVDEAYHHYVERSPEYESFIDRGVDDSRVIVTRSFSKIYGLAGLRVGYAIATPDTAQILESYGLTRAVNVVAATAAFAALDDREHVNNSMRLNADERQEFLNQTHARMLRSVDPHANFVMLDTGRQAATVVEHYRKNNIQLPPPFAPFAEHVRVSLRTAADMREFWRVWDLMPVLPVHRM